MHSAKSGVARVVAVMITLVSLVSASADVTIATFDDFWHDAVYGSWNAPETVIEYNSTNYVITATGYGSNWKYNPVDGSGYTNVELRVTLSGPPAADGHLGPIVSLVDGDGTYFNYAWYGQLLGYHVLTMPLASPTFINAQGTVPGLDLATLTHLHLQLDPGGFGRQGAYTVAWEHLSLTGPVQIVITPQTYNPATREFTIVWTSLPGKTYAVLHAPNLGLAFSPVVTGIPSGGSMTTNTVTMPAGQFGFLRIQVE